MNDAKQFSDALQVVIGRLNADLREATNKVEHLPANEWQSQHGRALMNREQELHTAWVVLDGMRSTQAEPVAVASPTMVQKIAGAHAADIKPSQAEAVYLAMLSAAPATDARIAAQRLTHFEDAMRSYFDSVDFTRAPKGHYINPVTGNWLRIWEMAQAAAASAAMSSQQGGTA